MNGYGVITVSKDDTDKIIVYLQYDPYLVAKIKTIEGRKWHPTEKHWSFPDTDVTLKQILEAFKGEEIHIDPILQAEPSSHVIASPDLSERSNLKTGSEQALQSQKDYFDNPPFPF